MQFNCLIICSANLLLANLFFFLTFHCLWRKYIRLEQILKFFNSKNFELATLFANLYSNLQNDYFLLIKGKVAILLYKITNSILNFFHFFNFFNFFNFLNFLNFIKFNFLKIQFFLQNRLVFTTKIENSSSES